MEKIGTLRGDVPQQLQWKTWFILHLHFAQRGVENDHSLKKDDISFNSKSGRKVLILRDFRTKNHRGSDLTKSTEGVVVETGGPNCPVAIVMEYMKRLHPKCEFFWQRTLPQYLPSDDTWFANAKVGHNTISAMMKNISIFLRLSKTYTNHCVRATCITVLGKSFQDNEIKAVSGHKTLQALGIYKRTSEDTLMSMSDTLHACMSKRKCDTKEGVPAPTMESIRAMPTPEIFDSEKTMNAMSTFEKSASEETINAMPMLEKSNSEETTNAMATRDETAQKYNDIANVCAQYDSRVFSQFSPQLQNCSHISFTFNFQK